MYFTGSTQTCDKSENFKEKNLRKLSLRSTIFNPFNDVMFMCYLNI